MARKYKTLSDLANAFKTGELLKTEWVLVLDNDDSFLRFIGDPQNCEDEDLYRDRMTDHADELYRGNGCADLQEACEAAGIPSEPC